MSTLGGTTAEYAAKCILLTVSARYVEPCEFGFLTVFTIVSTFASLFFTEGITPALIQRKELSDEEFHALFFFLLISASLVSMIVAVTSPILSRMMNAGNASSIVAILSPVIFVEILSVLPTTKLIRKGCYAEIAIIRAGTYVMIYFPIAITCLACGMGFWALVLATLVHGIVSIIWLFCRSRINPLSLMNRFRPFVLSSILRQSFAFVVGGFPNRIALKLDNLIVLSFLGTSAAGLYSRAYNLTTLPSALIGKSVSLVVFPHYARNQANDEVLRKNILIAFQVMGLAFAFITPFLLFFNHQLVHVVLGEKWHLVERILVALVPAMIFRIAYRFPGSVLKAKGLMRPWILSQYAYAIIVGLGSYWLVSFGEVGVGVAASIGVFCQFVAFTFVASRSIDLPFREILVNQTSNLATGASLTVVAFVIWKLLIQVNWPAYVVLSIALMVYFVPVVLILSFFFEVLIPGAIRNNLRSIRQSRKPCVTTV